MPASCQLPQGMEVEMEEIREEARIQTQVEAQDTQVAMGAMGAIPGHKAGKTKGMLRSWIPLPNGQERTTNQRG